jgi:hypothetical protein
MLVPWRDHNKMQYSNPSDVSVLYQDTSITMYRHFSCYSRDFQIWQQAAYLQTVYTQSITKHMNCVHGRTLILMDRPLVRLRKGPSMLIYEQPSFQMGYNMLTWSAPCPAESLQDKWIVLMHSTSCQITELLWALGSHSLRREHHCSRPFWVRGQEQAPSIVMGSFNWCNMLWCCIGLSTVWPEPLFCFCCRAAGRVAGTVAGRPAICGYSRGWRFLTWDETIYEGRN